MKILLVVVTIFISIILLVEDSMGDIPLQKIFLRSVIYIENSFSNIGTGVLVGKKIGDNKHAIFIITNKHILQNKERKKYADYLTVRFYRKDATAGSKIKNIKIILSNNGILSNRVFIHPEGTIDVAAIFISDIINSEKEIEPVNIAEDLLLTKDKMKEEVIEAGENVLILGYPAGIFSQENFLPIVKQGIIATSPQEDLKLRISNEIIQGKIILIEASLFGGSSGSPVFIKPRWKVRIKPETGQQEVRLGESMPVYLVGIQSSAIELKEKIYTRILEKDNNKNEKSDKQITPNAVVKKDEEGEFFELNKEIMLNIVFSSEYILDLFKEYDQRVKQAITVR